MKTLIYIFFIFFPFTFFAQKIVDSLPKENFRCNSEKIQSLPFSTALPGEISFFDSPKMAVPKLVKQSPKNVGVYKLLDLRFDTMDVVKRLSYNVENPFLVSYKGKKYYIKYSFNLPDDLKNLYYCHISKKYELKREERINNLLGKYGATDVQKVINLKLEIGMAYELILDVLGEPDQTRSSVTENVRFDYLIYKNFSNLNRDFGYALSTKNNIVMAFEDGKLSAIEF